MALGHSPSIVTNGLVFYVDQGNTQKSWKGAPTTNLLSISGWNTNFNGTAPYWASMTRNMVTTDLLFDGVNIGRGITSTAASYGFGYIDFPLPTGTTTGVVYACSFWYKSANRTASVWCHDTAGRNTAYSSSLPANGKWNRGVSIFTSTATGSVRLHFHLDAGSVGDVVYFTAPMIEQQSIGTPFVNGTRSNTQAILDIVGKNTVTTSSLTYNNDGSFSLNGSSDYYYTGPIAGIGSASTSFSMGVWVYPTGTSGNIISMSSAFPSGAWNEPPIRATGQQFQGHIYPNTYLSYSYSLNNWYYLVLVWDAASSTQYFYVNGNLVGSTSGISYSASGASNYLYFGQTNPGANNAGMFSGKISVAQVYTNKALTSSEVQQNFNALRGRFGL